jgi:hypothetical protein
MLKMNKLVLSLLMLVAMGAFQTHLNAQIPTQTDEQMLNNNNVTPYNTGPHGYNPQIGQSIEQQGGYYNPATTPGGYPDPSKTYNLTTPNQTYSYPDSSPYYTRQGYTAPPPAPIYGYGYYGSLPPPTPNQAFPDKAQSDALYDVIKNR